MPWYTRTQRAFVRRDVATWASVGLTFAAWFFLDTLHVAWGPIDRGVPFYDLAVAIASPPRLFIGIEGHRGTGTVLLVTLCVIALVAAALPHVWHSRFAWIAFGAPFALILIVALLLYWRTSDSAFVANIGSPDTIGNDLRHITHHVLQHLRANAARKVTVAPGGYLALLGSLLLLARGIRGFRAHHKGPEKP